MKKVFLPEYNCFGWEVPINVDISDPELFLSLCTDSQLKGLMDTQLKYELYETAAIIQKEIDKRTKL